MLALQSENHQLQHHSLATPPALDKEFLSHFSLVQKPFVSNLDSQTFYVYPSAYELLSTLEYAIQSGEGIVKISGESGSGKTYLTNRLMETLAKSHFIVNMLSTAATPKSFVMGILDEMGIEHRGDYSTQFMLKQLYSCLRAFHERFNIPVILVADNAEQLSTGVLAVMTTLSAFESQSQQLMQLVLLGNPLLDQKLKQPRLNSLVQRIGFAVELKAMNKSQTREYVTQRIKSSGNRNSDVFSSAALNAIYRASGGNPRRVNTLAHKGMMLAFGTGDRIVNKKHIREASADANSSGFASALAVIATSFVLTCLGVLGIWHYMT
ncbi:MAG: AAA family ATPase [Gammaproteobacteria bacterium]|nr:AAA family ATPase [Gammaproteobacteria bacterium]